MSFPDSFKGYMKFTFLLGIERLGIPKQGVLSVGWTLAITGVIIRALARI